MRMIGSGFSAYPQQQRHLQWRWKLVVPTLVTSTLCMVLYFSLDFGTGDAQKPGRSNEYIQGVHFLQPFFSATGMEIGIWTRQRGTTNDSNGSQNQAWDRTGGASRRGGLQVAIPPRPAPSIRMTDPTTTTVAPSTRNPHIDLLQKELAAERARSAAQEAELVRLRASVSNDGGFETPAKVVSIPDSLWREPPGKSNENVEEDEEEQKKIPAFAQSTLAHENDETSKKLLIQDETTTRTPSTTTLSTTIPLATKQVQSQGQNNGQGDHTITVKAGDREIVVQIGRSSQNEPAVATSAPTTLPPSTTPLESTHESAPTLETFLPSAAKSDPSPTTPNPPATTTTALTPTPALPSGKRENSITVKAGGSEIIVHFGDSEASQTHDEKAEVSSPTTLEVRAATTSTPESGVGPQALPHPTTTVEPLPSAVLVATSSISPLGTTFTVAVASEVGTTQPSEKQPEVFPSKESSPKESQGTKITVMSQGQSITIEVGGTKTDQAKAVEASTTQAPTTTLTPTSTTVPFPTSTGTITSVTSTVVPPSSMPTSLEISSMAEGKHSSGMLTGSIAASEVLQRAVSPQPDAAAHEPQLVSTLPPQKAPNEENAGSGQASSSEFANLALRAR